MNKCFDYQVGCDTGGNPIMARQCFCLTTACLQQPIQVTSTAGHHSPPCTEQHLDPEIEDAINKAMYGKVLSR